MRQLLWISCSTALMSLGSLFGQNPSVVGAGYSIPGIIRVSPGQITTVFVSGLKPDLTKPQRATSLPLPTSLAGISVTINQSSPKQSFVAPILIVEQLNNCSNGGAPPPPTIPSDCLIGAITIQIPYELTALPIVVGDFSVPSTTELVITTNGAVSKAFLVSVITDNLHVLNTCDVFPPKQGDGTWVDVTTFSNSGCSSTVTHANGTLVTASSAAKPGETIVIYAFGLGQTTPAVKTGAATPTPSPVLRSDNPFFNRTVGLQFDFRVNAGPSHPYVNPFAARPIGLPAPEFVGLTPDQVGLYQINVKLPDIFPPVDPCTALSIIAGNPSTLSNIALSNLTISMGGVSSFAGAAICVQPMQ